jgi:hypothetical protein
MNGADILILIEGTLVGSQRDASFEEANESIDASSKDSRAKRVEYGRYSASFSLESVYVPTDAAYILLLAAVRDGTKVTVRRQEEGSALEEAEAVLTGMSIAAPDQDIATVSISGEIDGEWAEVTT